MAASTELRNFTHTLEQTVKLQDLFLESQLWVFDFMGAVARALVTAGAAAAKPQ